MAVWKLPAPSDGACAYSDLREDFVYARIPRGRRAYYIGRGLALGREAAEQYAGRDMEALLAGDGVAVRRVEGPSPIGLHAQICYDGKNRQVDLFPATARELSQALDGTGLALSPEELERVFLAHEFYHWLEYSAGAPACAKCDPIEHKTLGLFPHRSRVRRVDEIAAFAFTKEFCRLPVHPKAMDYLLLYRRKGEDLPRIGARLQALEDEYRRECL